LSDRNLYKIKTICKEIQADQIASQAVAELHWGHIPGIFSKIKDKTQKKVLPAKSRSRSILEEKIKKVLYAQHKKFRGTLL